MNPRLNTNAIQSDAGMTENAKVTIAMMKVSAGIGTTAPLAIIQLILLSISVLELDAHGTLNAGHLTAIRMFAKKVTTTKCREGSLPLSSYLHLFSWGSPSSCFSSAEIRRSITTLTSTKRWRTAIRIRTE